MLGSMFASILNWKIDVKIAVEKRELLNGSLPIELFITSFLLAYKKQLHKTKMFGRKYQMHN